MASKVPGPWKRRTISGAALLSSAVLAPFVAPIAAVVAFFQDRRRDDGRFRQTRLVALVTSMVFIDFFGRLMVFGVWLRGPFGLNRTSPRIQAQYQKTMTWYTTQITSAISKIAPLPIDTSELDPELLAGNAIVVGRHRSVFDAALPGSILGRLGLTTFYVLKQDLQWDPNLDIVGHRMGHVFVNRTATDLDRELQPLRELASRLDDDSVGIIFPEGTFFHPTRLTRAVEAIERRDPERAAIARQLRHLLPPRPSGVLAMLEAAPTADVILLGHVGAEPYGSVPEIFANIGDLSHTLRVKAWRFERSTIPTGHEEQLQWLFERWLEMDDWIARNDPTPSAESRVST